MFEKLSNKQLIERINKRFKVGLNDDDEVKELFKRKKEQNLNIIIGFDYYELEE
jgi:tRNA A37 N6-isopentenylltransferase MiaA